MKTIDQALCDRKLLGAALGDSKSWQAWRVVLKATFGLALNRVEARAFAAVAGSRQPPAQRVRELWCICGRRSGKSRMSALIAVFLAAFGNYQLARSEVGMVLVLAASQSQAHTVFEYVRGFLEASPILRQEIAAVRAQEIRLHNGIVIAVHANSFRTVRGHTLVAAVLDEVSFWRDESSAMPDVETYRAILPSLATTNGMLIGISTPYRKIGLLHQKHRDHFGVDDNDVLVVQGASQTFNPSLSDKVLPAQRASDPTAAASEWDAEFRTDIGAYLEDGLIDAAIDHGRPLEIPPAGRGQVFYRAFVDASGGVGHDSYTIAVAHKEGQLFVVDLVRGTKGAFNPQQVTEEYAKLLRDYHIGNVVGDHYAAQWVAAEWRRNNISYVRSDLPKSAIYLEVLPLFARGLVRLPNHATLLRELRFLGTHIARAGTRSIIRKVVAMTMLMRSAACCGSCRSI
jgi:hypothetical protein